MKSPWANHSAFEKVKVSMGSVCEISRLVQTEARG